MRRGGYDFLDALFVEQLDVGLSQRHKSIFGANLAGRFAAAAFLFSDYSKADSSFAKDRSDGFGDLLASRVVARCTANEQEILSTFGEFGYFDVFCPHCPKVPNIQTNAGTLRINYDNSNVE